MAKGRPTNKIIKGAKGRKNHGPKRHLHHDISPKALRVQIAQTGVLSKYDDFDSFSVSLQARGVRADYRLLWEEFKHIPMIKTESGEFEFNRAAQNEFFANIKDIAITVMRNSKQKGATKGAE